MRQFISGNKRKTRLRKTISGLLYVGLLIILVSGLVVVNGMNSATHSAGKRGIMPSSQVRAGMRGYGLTVFKGTRVESFPVVVLGKLKTRIGESDMILIKVVGGYLTRNRLGIIAGMSGSPVYINGRLIGAIGYGWWFSKEPVGGVTPIENMMRELPRELKKKKISVNELPAREYYLDSPLDVDGNSFTTIRVSNTQVETPESVPKDTMVLAPVPTMLQVQGFSPRTVKMMKEQLKSRGLLPVAVPGGVRIAKKPASRIRPGSALGVTLVEGDLFIGGTGTVTYRDGDSILAFGHPMFMLGDTEMPLHAAYIEGIMPGMMFPFKFSSSLGIVGTMKQDRLFAISGNLGQEPPMIPVVIDVENVERNWRKRFNLKIIDHKYLTPMLMRYVSFETTFSSSSWLSDASAKIDYAIKIKGYPKVEFKEYVSSNDVQFDIGMQIRKYISMLTSEQFEPLEFEKFYLKIKIYPTSKIARIEDVSTQYRRVKPGDKVDLNIRLKTRQGKTLIETVKVPIPADIKNGKVKIAIAGGSTIDRLRRKLQVKEVEPVNVHQLVQRVRKAERNNDLVIEAAYPRKTVVFSGIKINNLPRSWKNIFQSSPRSSVTEMTDSFTTKVSLPYYVEGEALITLQVSGDVPAAPEASEEESVQEEKATDIPAEKEDQQTDKIGRLKALLSSSAETVVVSKQEIDGKKKKNEMVLPSGSYIASISTPHEYFLGNFENTSITNGNITLGYKTEDIYNSSQPFITALDYDPITGRLTAAESPSGYLLEYNGEAKPVIVGKTREVLVPCLARDSLGNVYAGTGPNGRIFKLSPDGKLTLFCTLEEDIIWDLKMESEGTLLAATGNTGKIYRIDSDGQSKVIFDPSEVHVTSLELTPSGEIFAGCANEGTVYKLDKSGEFSPYYKTLGNSVDSMLYHDGNLWLASDELLYRIGDNDQTKVYIFPEGSVIKVKRDLEGNILAGTSNLGRIYRISPEGKITNLFEDKLNQAMDIVQINNGDLIVASGNPGRLIRVKKDYNSQGEYFSRVLDAGKFSRFGRIEWLDVIPEGTELTLQTRSGNTAAPDHSWSDWSAEYTMKEGQKILSPPARYIQVKANFKTTDPEKTPILYDISLYYTHQNLAPVMDVEKPHGAEKWSGKVEMRWKAYLANRQTLSYSLFYSPDNGETWKPIEENIEAKLREQPVDDNKSNPKPPVDKYEWMTRKVKDGRYLIKIRAFDRTNPDDETLSAEFISKLITINNTEPDITIMEAVGDEKQARITGFIKTNLVNIKEVLYKINDDKDWSLAYPLDGIFDNNREKFIIYLNKPYPRSFRLKVKATDESGVAGERSKYIRIKEIKNNEKEEGEDS